MLKFQIKYILIFCFIFSIAFFAHSTSFNTVKADEANDIYYQCTLPCWKDYTQGDPGDPSCRERCPVSGGRYDETCLTNCQIQENACNDRCTKQYYANKKSQQRESEPTEGSQNNAGDSFTGEFIPLWGGLARPFDELLLESKKIAPEKTHDIAGNEMKIEKAAKNWQEGKPVKFESRVENLQKNQLVSSELPEGLPVGKALYSTAEPLKYARTEITIFDGATTPKLLHQEEKGGPIEYDEQGIPDEPDQKKYDMDFYFRVGTVAADGEEIHPFKEAMFELFPQLPDPDVYHRIKVLRWYNDQQKWNELPLQSNDCGKDGKKCRIIAQSPGTSYFAVVVEKDQYSTIKTILGAVFYLSIVALVALIIFRKRFRKRAVITLIALLLFLIIASFIGGVYVAQK